MDHMLIELARKHFDLDFGLLDSEMVGCAAAPGTKPLLQLWIPSEFVSHIAPLSRFHLRQRVCQV